MRKGCEYGEAPSRTLKLWVTVKISEGLRTGMPLPSPSPLSWPGPQKQLVDKRVWWLLIFPQLKAVALEDGLSTSAPLTFWARSFSVPGGHLARRRMQRYSWALPTGCQ